jgi:hypothetical protein
MAHPQLPTSHQALATPEHCQNFQPTGSLPLTSVTTSPAQAITSQPSLPVPAQVTLQYAKDHSIQPLTPLLLTLSQEKKFHHILPLLPITSGQPQVQSSCDLILPSPGAFSLPNSSLSPTFPQFHTSNYTWNHVLSLVVQPSLLWTCYTPKSLGDYPDIKSLWEAWEEGMMIKGVGCTPPIRLVDERWGTQKGHRASWRPAADPQVSFSPATE